MSDILNQIQQLDDQQKAITEQRVAMREAAIADVNEMIKAFGLTDAEITLPAAAKSRAGRKAAGDKKPRGKVAPKYRTPEGVTWTGRGKMPTAMAQWLKDNGKSKEDIAIA